MFAKSLTLFFAQFRHVFTNGETTELSGMCIVNLATGRIILYEKVFTSVRFLHGHSNAQQKGFMDKCFVEL